MKTVKWLSLLAMLSSMLLVAACSSASPAADSGAGSEDGSGKEAASPASGAGEVGERISVAGDTFTRVAPVELREMMKSEDFVVVNTHVPFAGNIPGTDLSIPYDEMDQNLDRLRGKDSRILLYCLGGPMSESAAETLVRLGYTNVWDLDGGMEAWRAAGFPLEDA